MPKGSSAERRDDAPGLETILIVEDDEAVSRAVSRILTRRGYEVLEARTPEDAEALWARRGIDIDLLMIDLLLPHTTGRELAGRLLATRAETPVLFMSGYSRDSALQLGLLEPGMNFLAKPFTVASVEGKVREALDG